MSNKELQSKYDEMHSKGPISWFSDGREERETILEMGEPWDGLDVLEIGCGEGDLCKAMADKGAYVIGIDYSAVAIDKADKKSTGRLSFWAGDYTKFDWEDYGNPTCIVMQGVLEHLDDPFGELQWMIDHFKPKTVITSSPCFLNPRGIVWMTMDMLGAVMSKTDLHYLNPWEFEEFCKKHGYELDIQDCDWDWGNGKDMIADLAQRIPLALRDGGLKSKKATSELLEWLSRFKFDIAPGATMVYRIDID